MVGLMATGGSTNHFIHLPAIARAAGIEINWDDFAEHRSVTPLLARIYPNGSADVNHFHAAGGMGFLMRELLERWLAAWRHRDRGAAMAWPPMRASRALDGERWPGAMRRPRSGDDSDLARPAADPFRRDGGLRLDERRAWARGA